MQNKQTRKWPPWPVAPIPLVPTFPSGASFSEKEELLDSWFAELDFWLHTSRKRNALFRARLPKVERQIRILSKHTAEYFSENDTCDASCASNQKMAAQHELLARCLSYQCDETKDEEAAAKFKAAIAMAPSILEYSLSYIRHLIRRGLLCSAIEEINAIDLAHLESEAEEGAMVIANWALSHSEIAFGIHPDIIKHCVALVSRGRRAQIVMGAPRFTTPVGKRNRPEIYRILTCALFGSLPLDELCRIEDIEDTVLYRWFKHFL